MNYERLKQTTADAFEIETLKDRARAIDDDHALTVLGRAAVLEIEAYADLALLGQTIITTMDKGGPLPVGPWWREGEAEHAPSVMSYAPDGSFVPMTEGWYFEKGPHPAIWFTTPLREFVTVSYPAGFGLTAAAVPADLALAVADHAARLYDMRAAEDGPQGLSVAAARICARYRRVRA